MKFTSSLKTQRFHSVTKEFQFRLQHFNLIFFYHKIERNFCAKKYFCMLFQTCTCMLFYFCLTIDPPRFSHEGRRLNARVSKILTFPFSALTNSLVLFFIIFLKLYDTSRRIENLWIILLACPFWFELKAHTTQNKIKKTFHASRIEKFR